MPAKSKNLTQFRVDRSGSDFTMHIEDDGGEAIEFTVTRDQLEVIVDSLDDLLADEEDEEDEDD